MQQVELESVVARRLCSASDTVPIEVRHPCCPMTVFLRVEEFVDPEALPARYLHIILWTLIGTANHDAESFGRETREWTPHVEREGSRVY